MSDLGRKFIFALALAACSPTPPETSGGPLDCTSPINYDGRTVKADVALGSIFGTGGEVSDTAVRQPREKIEAYYAGLNRLCKDYNSDLLSKEQYRQRADQLTQNLLGEFAPTGAQKQQFAQVYEAILPEDVKGKPLELSFDMLAQMPGQPGEVTVRPNQPVPTGARIGFAVKVNQAAHLYMFQKTQQNGVTALFPHPQMALQNPLGVGQEYRIPPPPVGQYFEVDADDIGTERVYLLASTAPLPDLGTALAQMAERSGDPSLSEFQPLQPLAQLTPGAAGKDCRTRALVLKNDGNGCSRTRGLVLVGGQDNLEPGQAPPASLVVRTDPGDDTIVKVFPWDHTTADEYKAAAESYDAPDENGRRTRGILME